jgi:polysaccharide biosynthesis/export protein
MPRLVYLTCLIALSQGCAGSTSNLTGLKNPLHPSAKEFAISGGLDLPRELSMAPLDEYRVQPGDGLLILPTELDSTIRVPADQTILQDGSIDLGRFGKMIVNGKTVMEVEKMVQDTVKTIEPKAGYLDVRLVNRTSKVYYVLGEVLTPGKYSITGNETVLDGIIAAGGLSDRASRERILLVRPDAQACGSVLGVCYNHIVQLGDTRTNYQIQPGDRIYVSSMGLHELIRSLLGKTN